MNNRYKYGLQAPHQSSNRYGHPDSYTGFPASGNQQPNHYPYGTNTYGGGTYSSQQAYGGYQSYQRHAHQGFGHAPLGYYGNPTEIRVSDPNWADALLEAIRQGQEIDLIFDIPSIVEQLVQAVIEKIGSFTDIIRQHAERAIDELFSSGMVYPNPDVRIPAQAMLAPVVVAALIAAIIPLGLAIIYAVIAYNNANASRAVAEAAIARGCELMDIETISVGSGSSENGGGWFDFLNGSKWKIRCPGQ